MMRIKSLFGKGGKSHGRSYTDGWSSGHHDTRQSSNYSIDEDGGDSDSETQDIAIAIMGATGSGKSTFVNLISGSGLPVSDGLRSCTTEIELSNSFVVDGRRVHLIDTPGFDDTTRSDTDVLNGIAAFLATSYKNGCKLAGVLYMHRITDVRIGGVSARNARMFRKLCGDDTLKNVIIITNMWGQVDPQIGRAREAELKRDDLFFKPALDKGARMVRHENTPASAEAILRLVLDNHPLALRIQEELVDQEKDIAETSAGEELSQEFNAQLKKYQEEVLSLKKEIQDVIRKKDEQMRRELEAERETMRKQIERVEMEVRRLAPGYQQEREKFEGILTQAKSRGKGRKRGITWSMFKLRKGGGTLR